MTVLRLGIDSASRRFKTTSTAGLALDDNDDEELGAVLIVDVVVDWFDNASFSTTGACEFVGEEIGSVDRGGIFLDDVVDLDGNDEDGDTVVVVVAVGDAVVIVTFLVEDALT